MLMIIMALAAQATVLPDVPRSYVSAEGAGQRPCQVVTGEPPLSERFQNRLLVGDWTLRTERGTSSCSFHQTDAGRCGLDSPGHLAVERGDAKTVYVIPDNSAVELEIRDGRHACRIGRRVRTHGDTIVPNL